MSSKHHSHPEGLPQENGAQGGHEENALRDNGIHDPRLTAAMRTVPERLFDAHRRARATEGGDRTPLRFNTLVALMVQALELRGHERVLDIGTGSGYRAALLGRLAREVYSVEWEPNVAATATRRLSELGLHNVHVATGDASKGWPCAAPYQAIVVGAGSPDVPQELIDQLDEGGRLVIPVGDDACQLVERFRKNRQTLECEVITWCTLPRLRVAHTGRRSSRPWMKAQRTS